MGAADYPGGSITKFGRNTDSDTGDDIWDGSAPYPFPTQAGATTLVSNSPADTLDGASAQVIAVQGLDADYKEITQYVPMNGTTSKNLKGLLRVYRMWVDQAGTGGVNNGTITCQIGGVTCAQIVANIGQTLMAVYTLPDETWGWMQGWRASCDSTGDVQLALQAKSYKEPPHLGAWNTKDVIQLDSTGSMNLTVQYPTYRMFAPRTDFRVRVLNGGNNFVISAQFDMLLTDEPELILD